MNGMLDQTRTSGPAPLCLTAGAAALGLARFGPEEAEGAERAEQKRNGAAAVRRSRSPFAGPLVPDFSLIGPQDWSQVGTNVQMIQATSHQRDVTSGVAMDACQATVPATEREHPPLSHMRLRQESIATSRSDSPLPDTTA